MIYIACPYSSSDNEVVLDRMKKLNKFTADVITKGWMAFSPVTMCHPLAQDHALPGDFNFWKTYNFHMIDLCEELWVLCLPGWTASKGVAGEIQHAMSLKKRVRYFENETPLPDPPKVLSQR